MAPEGLIHHTTTSSNLTLAFYTKEREKNEQQQQQQQQQQHQQQQQRDVLYSVYFFSTVEWMTAWLSYIVYISETMYHAFFMHASSNIKGTIILCGRASNKIKYNHISKFGLQMRSGGKFIRAHKLSRSESYLDTWWGNKDEDLRVMSFARKNSLLLASFFLLLSRLKRKH